MNIDDADNVTTEVNDNVKDKGIDDLQDDTDHLSIVQAARAIAQYICGSAHTQTMASSA